MGRAAEDLHRERGLNAARAFFQKANVLLFRFTNAAQRGAETHADAIVRFVVRIFESCVVQRELCRRDRELHVTIESLQSMRGKKFFRIPVVDLTRHPNAELAYVEIVDLGNARLLGANSIPKALDAFADASNGTKTGDDNASAAHAITRLA